MALPFLPAIKPRWTPARNLTKLYGSNWAWFRPSLSPLNIWQDSAGSTAVTAAAQSVGFASDYRGVELGPELVTNGDFGSGTGNWAYTNVTASIDSGRLKLVSTGTTNLYAAQTTSTVVGKTYRLQCDLLAPSANTTTNAARAALNLPATTYVESLTEDVTQTKSTVFIAATTSTEIRLGVASWAAWGASGDIAYFDNVSVREITNAYALQATTANKPTYYADARSVPVLRHDTTDGLTATFATTLGSAASVYYVTGSGVTQSHGVNVGTSYALPGKPGAGTADVYEYLLLPSRPDAKTESEIVKWLTKTAGL